MPIARYNDVVNIIANRLAQVPNIGRVHNYLRNLNSAEQAKQELYDETLGRIAGWMITREAPLTDTQSTNLENTLEHSFILHGIMTIEDSQQTELVFQQLINDICAQFRPQDNLDNLVELIHPIQARVINQIMYPRADSGYLCHHAELVLTVQEFYQS